jgi:hypothetical protein
MAMRAVGMGEAGKSVKANPRRSLNDATFTFASEIPRPWAPGQHPPSNLKTVFERR